MGVSENSGYLICRVLIMTILRFRVFTILWPPIVGNSHIPELRGFGTLNQEFWSLCEVARSMSLLAHFFDGSVGFMGTQVGESHG